jgi:transposase
MLNPSQRTAILELHKKNLGTRRIARALKVSRDAVKKVIRSESSIPPPIVRPEKAEEYRQELLDLYASCQGNLVRVHEELQEAGADISYPALTAFCRRHGIGHTPPLPAGQYHFEPAEECQHDTSPHEIKIGGRIRKVQTASTVLCYSRMLFFQCYPTFQRFDCKLFLTEALKYYGGSCKHMMIDNTHVVVLRGTGPDMIPVPEMEAFADRYSFKFRAHKIRDANRSGRVERPFQFIEKNFLNGREFSDWEDLNRRAREWCDKVNSKYKKHIRAVPRELFAIELPQLNPLPLWIPEVYRLQHRIVDVEGYVAVHTNRYSVPWTWIGKQVEVRETRDSIEIQYGIRQLIRHARIIEPIGKRITLPEHRPAWGQGIKRTDPRPEEKTLGELVPEISGYVSALRTHGRKYITVALRQLLRMAREYPRDAFLSATAEASRYGLYDLDRVESMILRRIATEYFRLETLN